MKRVGNRGETHAWFDGEGWCLYTERAADIRRFSEWFGPPVRRGREDTTATWENLPRESLRVAKRFSRPTGMPIPAPRSRTVRGSGERRGSNGL